MIKPDPSETLNDFFAFSLGLETTEGTVIQQRIKDVIANQGHSASVLYQPRASNGGKIDPKTQINKNLYRYSEDLLNYIKDAAGDLLYFFGYVDVDEKSSTPFFKFEKHDPAAITQNERFKMWNKQVLTHLIHHDEAQESTFLKSQEGFDSFLKLYSDVVKDHQLINDNLPITIAE